MPDIEQKTKDIKFKPTEAIKPGQEAIPSTEEKIAEKEPVLFPKPLEIEKEKGIEDLTEREKTIIKTPEEAGQPVSPAGPPSDIKTQVRNLQTLDRENQVKALCQLALDKSIDFALEIAKQLDNAYVLDEFHDSLVDELQQRLFKEGKLKKL